MFEDILDWPDTKEEDLNEADVVDEDCYCVDEGDEYECDNTCKRCGHH